MKRSQLNALLLAVSIVLTACGAASQPEPGNPNDPDPGPLNPAECRNVITKDITVSTTFRNGPEDCDYFFSDSKQYEVTAALTVEPGTVLRFASNALLTVTATGSIQAVGGSDNRIVFAGASNSNGFWRGICFGTNRASRLENVDVFWAGQAPDPESFSCRGAISGTFGAGEPLDLVNVRQYGSHTNGLNAQQLPLGEFRGNAFGGNIDYGVAIDADKVESLDAASDYLGHTVGDENGRPFIHVGGLLQETGRTYEWSELNVPYAVDYYAPGYGSSVLVDFGAELVLLEGVEIHFGAETSLNATNQSTLEARGTPDDPVVLTGMQASRGSWQGVWVHLSKVNFQNLHIYWGGDPAAGNSSGLHLDGGFDTMHINGLHVEGSGSCGITVDEMAFSRLETFDNVTYVNNVADLCGP